MPDSINGLSNLQSKLFKENFFHVIDSLPRKEVQIFLPQLSTVTNGLEMSSFLKMLGVISAFTEYRDRDAHPTETYVQSIRQNAFFSTSFTALNSVGSVSTRIGKTAFYDQLCLEDFFLFQFKTSIFLDENKTLHFVRYFVYSLKETSLFQFLIFLFSAFFFSSRSFYFSRKFIVLFLLSFKIKCCNLIKHTYSYIIRK